MSWTKPIAAADLPVDFTDPTDAVTRGRAATWVQALSPGGSVVVTLDGGSEEELTFAAGQVIPGSYVTAVAADCDLLAGNGEPPDPSPVSYDAINASLTSTTGVIDLPPTSFHLLTGAPMAAFANGASAVPGVAMVDSKALAVRWNNNATLDAIACSFTMPADCDVTANATLVLHASKIGATSGDLPTFTVGLYNQVIGALHDADADFGGSTSAMSNAATKTVQALTLTLALANLAAFPASATIIIKPADGLLSTDDVALHSAYILYKRKLAS